MNRKDKGKEALRIVNGDAGVGSSRDLVPYRSDWKPSQTGMKLPVGKVLN